MSLLAAERLAVGTALRGYLNRWSEMAEDRQELLAVVDKYVSSGYKALTPMEVEQINFLLDELKQ